MSSIKLSESTVRCTEEKCEEEQPALACTEPGDVIFYGHTSINNLTCRSCGSAVEPVDVKWLYPENHQ